MTKKRFTELAALRAAVLDAVTNGWRAAAGRDLTLEDRANFADPDQPAEDLEAERISQLLQEALTAAADFDRSARGPTPAERTASWARAALATYSSR